MAWLATAGLGCVLVTTWLARLASGRRAGYGPVPSRPPPYIPAPLVVSHLTLAVGGLVVWCFYLAVDASMLAWLALAMLLPVALMGLSMFVRWIGSRRLRRPFREGPAESRLPVVVVFSHGLAGSVTVCLVALSTLGVGGGS